MITPQNLSLLNSFTLSANANARITTALMAGKVVLTPQQEVQINGTPTVGWYEMDPNTGETIGVMEDGGHQGIVEQILTLVGVTAVYNQAVKNVTYAIQNWNSLSAGNSKTFLERGR